MSDERRENRGRSSPSEPARADARADMTTAPHGPRFGPADLQDPERALEVLAHWDELDPELLRAIETDPRHARSLATLRAAEDWLHRSRERRAGVLPGSGRLQGAFEELCPDADELYDFGGGPGAASLHAARRASIEAHVRSCAACLELVGTLASPPPVPWEAAPLEPAPAPVRSAAAEGLARAFAPATPAARPPAHPAHPAHRAVARPRWTALAAAAGLLLAAGLWLAQSGSGTHAGPAQGPVLRGRSDERLLAPRGRVLPAASALRAAFPALGEGTAFELAPIAGARRYEVELFRATSDAFARGERVAKGASTEPLVTVPTALAPGRYTWEAWADVDGVLTALGTRDFEVADDPEVERELQALLPATADDERTERALRLLDARGYASDARRLARTLPAGELRERWLAPVPGR